MDNTNMPSNEMIMKTQEVFKRQQDQIAEIQNRDYSAKYKGLTITVKGSLKIVSVSIDQNFFEVASKDLLELAFTKAYSNVYTAITSDHEEISRQAQEELKAIQNGEIFK